MSPVTIGVLAVSMSVDAFIASLGKGATGPRPSFATALRTGAIFGLIEALTPLIGWSAGVAASQYIALVDHWIAFSLLAAVGGHMLFQALAAPADRPPAPPSLWATVVTALGTSIDAMAVGVSLAFLEVNILIIAAVIGVTTMAMSAAGLCAGRALGQRFGRIAEGFGGCALMGLGAMILFQHLSAG